MNILKIITILLLFSQPAFSIQGQRVFVNYPMQNSIFNITTCYWLFYYDNSSNNVTMMSGTNIDTWVEITPLTKCSGPSQYDIYYLDPYFLLVCARDNESMISKLIKPSPDTTSRVFNDTDILERGTYRHLSVAMDEEYNFYLSYYNVVDQHLYLLYRNVYDETTSIEKISDVKSTPWYSKLLPTEKGMILMYTSDNNTIHLKTLNDGTETQTKYKVDEGYSWSATIHDKGIALSYQNTTKSLQYSVYDVFNGVWHEERVAQLSYKTSPAISRLENGSYIVAWYNQPDSRLQYRYGDSTFGWNKSYPIRQRVEMNKNYFISCYPEESFGHIGIIFRDREGIQTDHYGPLIPPAYSGAGWKKQGSTTITVVQIFISALIAYAILKRILGTGEV